jgi:hypothetical protein
MKRLTIRYTIIGALVTVAIWAVYLGLVRAFVDPQNQGPFGDSFGALNTLFTGWAFVAVVATLVQQSHQIEEAKRDIALERRMDQDRMRLDLYGRRFDIYTAVLDFVGHVSSTDNVGVAHVVAFDKARSEAYFLFSEDSGLLAYLKELRSKGEDCNTLHSLLQQVGPPPNDQRSDYSRRLLAAKEWFGEQHDVIRERFKPYLAFGGTWA